MRFLKTSLATVCLWLCWACQGSAADLEQLLRDGRVPGLSLAVIRAGKIVETKALGVRDISTGAPVDENTIFEAASLSKPVFAYAVLQLVDDGMLSLDTPLSTYVPDFVKDDPRAASITVRNVLRQSSGLPNWRSSSTPLKTYFPPGERFSYSGEGFVWLQRVVEKITSQPLNDVVTRLVFDPLDMKRSSYVWRADFEADYAAPHDFQPAPGNKRRPSKAGSAATLQTTAADYAALPASGFVQCAPKARNCKAMAGAADQTAAAMHSMPLNRPTGRRSAYRLGAGLGPGTRCRHVLPLG